jgi:phosphoglycolate phosphatase
MVMQNLRLTGANPAKTIVIGDATHDMAMATAASVRGLGVSWGFAEAEELRSAGAHDVHETYASLTEAIFAFERETSV